MGIRTAAPVLSALALAGSAGASIINVAGQAQFLNTPPLSALYGAMPGPPAYCWDEQQNVSGVFNVNLTSNGTFTGNTPYFGTVGGAFDSHMIHFDTAAGLNQATGFVWFNNPIVAVIYDAQLLDNTDLPLGSGSTVYPTFNPQRSHTLILGPSIVQISGTMLRFDLTAMVPGMQLAELRVLTHAVPAPGPLALAGLGGLCCFRRRR